MTLETGPSERLERLFHADFAVVLALIHPNDRGVTLKSADLCMAAIRKAKLSNL